MKSRPLYEKLTVFAFLIVIGYFVGDLALLLLRGGMFPQQPPPARPVARSNAPLSNAGSFAAITQRNVFNSDGKVPPAKGDNGNRTNEPPKCPAEPPASVLPITLLGTIVHANPHRSIATVSSRSKNDQFAVRVDMMIPDNVATVKEISRNKIVVLAPGKACPEFVELKDDAKLSFSQAKAPVLQNGPVMQKSDTEFELKRGDIDKLTNNLPELLQQARAVPRMGPNGQIECFSMADIATGSIYEKLGLRRGDCIKSVNGERIDSPAKAMELYNALRSNANSINLGLDRGGRDENMNYNITQ